MRKNLHFSLNERKIVDYKILRCSHIMIESEVFEHIRRGWQPLGSVIWDTHGTSFVQTLVRYEDVKNTVSLSLMDFLE